MSTVAVSTFLTTLRRSNLLTPEQIAFAIDVGRRGDAADVARELLERRWLTEWQTHQLLAGKSRLFLGKYKLLDVLGSGGMGAVFKAESSTTRRPVALKVLAASLNSDEVARARFEREIRASAQVNHPNIVRALDADHFDDRVFLVMEYFEGADLKALLKQHQRLPIDFACECIRQAALGLQHAHEQGLVHRDIKPSNLLVTRQPDSGELLVKVLDLGLARLTADGGTSVDMTRVGQIMGSPDYMAPEQSMDSRSADHRSDIYGLGMTLFHLIAGELPYDGDTVMEKLLSRINVDAPPLSRYRPEVPPVLVHIVARMLHRDPLQRFQTAGEVASILGTFVSDPRALEPLIVPPQAPAEEPPTLPAAGDQTLQQIDAILDSRAHTLPLSYRRPRRGRSSLTPVVVSIGTALLLIGALLLAAWSPSSESSSRNSTDQPLSGDAATETPAASESGPPPDPDSPDDVVTRWALSMNRPSVIQFDGQERTLRTPLEIPEGRYRLLEVDLSGMRELDSQRIRQLAGVSSLRRLDLSGADVRDAQLQQLTGLTSLESLDVSGTAITERSVEVLSGFTGLKQLALRYLPVGRSGLQELASLPHLSRLDLTGTDIRDRELDVIERLSALRTLRLRHTSVTLDGLRRLRENRPDLSIE